ncbi:MAG: hypothetical protein KCHDKBKB_01444 [Elusimicrobia bacterium]|nr:hypothetical protein [Elusimicrobiota bacterium]
MFSLLLIVGATINEAKVFAAPTFTAETGPFLSSGQPQMVIPSTGNYRMYFIRDYRVLSATSTDGLAWGIEAGLRLSSATTPTISVSSITGFSALSLTAGGYRSLFSAIDSSGVYRIHSATSADGLGWANESSTRIAAASTGTFMGSPRLLKLTNGDWRLFFVQNINGAADEANRQIYTSLSSDEGVTWSTTSIVLSQQVGEICVATLTNSRVRLLYTAPLTGETTNSQLLSAISANANGTSFSLEEGVRFSTTSSLGPLSFPVLFRSTETYRWRVYYAFTAAGSTTPHMYSALTLTPDPQSMSPNSANRTDVASVFTISGEIFSPSPTLKITRSGQTDGNGTSVSRVDDQTITATFDPAGKDLGYWSLVVTNADTQTGTLANALYVTFSGGNIVVTDNLLRPLKGAQTRFDLTIYDSGRIYVRLYTLDGRLIRTLMDQQATVGTHTVFWDGKNESGNLVASGTYVVTIEGPKLESVTKIVVIK